MPKFYKGLMESMLTLSIHPKNVTTDIHVAVKHMQRMSSTDVCIIEITYDGLLYNYHTYKKEVDFGHDDISGYTNPEHTKAMLNTICLYRKLSQKEVEELMEKQTA